MTIADIAEQSGLKAVTINYYVRKGKLKATKTKSNQYVITEHDAAVFLAARFFDNLGKKR